MTADTHVRCTDRVAEAARDLDADIVVNIQGDEPLIHPDAIDLLCEAALRSSDLPCVNLANVITREEDFLNPNQIKAVCDQKDNALYMSRQPIPTTKAWSGTRVLRQLGMIAFRKEFLVTFAALPPTPLETAESVDMLRAIEHGYTVRMVISAHESFGVDTPEDLRTAEARLIGDPIDAAVFPDARR
jgi:3-deoxy-manno-octulosonate cytidylyltransferase (CMP-KDO synthetase)